MRNAAWTVNMIAQAALFARAAGWPRFRWWLGATVLSDLALRQFDPRSKTYFDLFVIREPLLIALFALAVWELLRLRAQPWAYGVGQAGRWLLAAALVGTVAVSLLIDAPTWARLPAMLWTARQVAVAIAALALGVSLAALGRWRVDTPATVVTQHRFLAAYALLQGAGVLAYRWRVADANTAILGAGAGLFLAWAVAIRQPGQVDRLTPGADAELVNAAAREELRAMRRAAGRQTE